MRIKGFYATATSMEYVLLWWYIGYVYNSEYISWIEDDTDAHIRHTYMHTDSIDVVTCSIHMAIQVHAISVPYVKWIEHIVNCTSQAKMYMYIIIGIVHLRNAWHWYCL